MIYIQSIESRKIKEDEKKLEIKRKEKLFLFSGLSARVQLNTDWCISLSVKLLVALVLIRKMNCHAWL